ncbi:MAG: PLP-dependent aminotransferase family protein [Gaiellales bacterium]
MSVISFARGVPSPDILPLAELAEASRAVIEREGRAILNYGPPFGYPPLREWLAARHDVDASRVVLTPGSLQGLNFVSQILFADGGRSIVEGPTYDRTLVVLRGVGATIEAVPLSEDGLDLDRLEALLATGPPATLVYLIPTFQNPSGRTLSLDQRRAVVELARARGVTLFEDDPYRLVRYEGEPLPTLHELAGGSGVIFSSSFSKTAAPGLRVGYLVVPDEMVEPMRAVASATYIAPAQLPQAAVYELGYREGLDPTLERTISVLRARRDAMLRALEAEFPSGCSWSHPDGGYFLWVDLPAGVDAAQLLVAAEAEGVTFVKGADFFDDGQGESALRLAFSFPSVEEIRQGAAVLGRLLGARG